MSNLEQLFRIIEGLPADKQAELLRIAVSMLPAEGAAEGDAAFEAAMDRTFQNFDKTLRRLAQ